MDAPIYDGTTTYCNDTGYNKMNFGENLEQTSTLGLANNVRGPSNIYDTFPNPFEQGAPLPRPYGPRDNLAMTYPFRYGVKKSRKKGKGGKGKRKDKKSKKKERMNFGNYNGQEYVDNILAPAKGYIYSYLPINVNSSYNVPMLYTNNNLNTPIFRNSFGSYGKNNVAYQEPIPMFHAGGTTLNYGTNELYSPIGIIGGATNSITNDYSSVGTFTKPILGVVPQTIDSNTYLSNSNIETSMNNSGPFKNNFGSSELLFQPELVTGGGGPITIYQPKPMYMDQKQTPPGDYVSSFGDSIHQYQPKNQPKKQKEDQKYSFSKKIIQKQTTPTKQPVKITQKQTIPVKIPEKITQKQTMPVKIPEKITQKQTNSSIPSKKFDLTTKFKGFNITLTKNGRIKID